MKKTLTVLMIITFFLNAILKGISFIKFPAPALKFTKNNIQLIPIQY